MSQQYEPGYDPDYYGDSERMKVPDLLITCDRCGNDFLVICPDDPDDVFYKVYEQMGRTVCPECLQEASESREL